MKTAVELRFLSVDSGTEHYVTVPAGSSAEDMARTIARELRPGGIILTGVRIDSAGAEPAEGRTAL